ncbi:MAG: HEPN domain-containing protein [Anaerolineae bacterium]
MEELSTSHHVSTALKDAALELDKVYIPAHYPNAHPSGSPRRRYTRLEAERMVAYAEQIIQFCAHLLSSHQP